MWPLVHTHMTPTRTVKGTPDLDARTLSGCSGSRGPSCTLTVCGLRGRAPCSCSCSSVSIFQVSVHLDNSLHKNTSNRRKRRYPRAEMGTGVERESLKQSRRPCTKRSPGRRRQPVPTFHLSTGPVPLNSERLLFLRNVLPKEGTGAPTPAPVSLACRRRRPPADLSLHTD